MAERVFITGLGIITSIGTNTEENLQSLIASRSGFGTLDILETIHRETLPACELKLSDEQLQTLAGVQNQKGFTRTALFALRAATEALQSAGLSSTEINQLGLVSATTTGGIREFEKHFNTILNLQQHGDFTQFTDVANPGEHTERLADCLGIKKYLATISTACSSSANAIMHGAQLIKHGKLQRVLCGGSEALSKFTINGFNTLMIHDSKHCRPFDSTRNGLNLGEGAAYVVLESESVVKRQNKKPLAELTGYGNANDTFHQTASSPEGAGARQAMHAALTMARLSPDQISYINAHGTATENNDLSEGRGIQKLFGERVPLFSSTKPFTGHTLAAAGSIEAVFSVLALQQQMAWPNLNFVNAMPELTITPIQKLQQLVAVKHVLSNSFGFGGNTSSLILSAV